jgi:hypothetical protein
VRTTRSASSSTLNNLLNVLKHKPVKMNVPSPGVFNPNKHNAVGTSFFAGGMTWVGERGPEDVYLPRGSAIQTAQASARARAAAAPRSARDRAAGVEAGQPRGVAGHVGAEAEPWRRDPRAGVVVPFETNPRLPGVKVEIAFDSGFSTLEGARTWTDVSADVSGTDGLSIGYGRTDQQPSADPNQLTLTLKNNTGKFTPGNASSPYYPNVKKGKPIRVSVTYAASFVRFTGYVNEWPVVWPDGSDRASQVTITAVSRRARLGQTAPLTSAIRAAYLATLSDGVLADG